MLMPKVKSLSPVPADLIKGKEVRMWLDRANGKEFRLPLHTNKNAKPSILDIRGSTFISTVGKRPTLNVGSYGKSIKPLKGTTSSKANLIRSSGKWSTDDFDTSDLAKLSNTGDKRKLMDKVFRGQISEEEYKDAVRKLKTSPALVSVRHPDYGHVYAKNVTYNPSVKKGGIYYPNQADEPRQVIATLTDRKRKTNVDPSDKIGSIKIGAKKHPVYNTLGVGFKSSRIYLLCDL